MNDTTTDLHKNLREIFENLYRKYFPYILGLCAVAVLGSVLRSVNDGWKPLYSFHASLVGTLLLLWVIGRNRKDFFFGKTVLIILTLNGTVNLLSNGLSSVGMLIFVIVIISITLFYGIKIGILSIPFYIMIIFFAGLAVHNGIVPVRHDIADYVKSSEGWVAQGSAFLFLAVFSVITISVVPNHLFTLIEKIKSDEKELTKSEKRYRLLIENLPSVVWVTDQKAKTVYISPNVEQVYGYSSEEIISGGDELWLGRIHSEDVGNVKKCFESLFSTGREFNVQYRIRCKDGEWIWLYDRANLTENIDGEMVAYGVFSDISESKKVDAALQQSENRFRSIVEETTGIVLILAPDYSIVEFNPEAERVYGVSREEVLGKNYIEYCLPEDERERVVADVQKVLAGTPTRGFENRVRTSGGEERIVVWNVSVLHGSSQETVGIIAAGQDVTDRRKIEEQLKASELNYRTLFESANDAIWIHEGEVFVDCNNKILEMFGCDRDKIIGKRPSDFSPEIQPDGQRSEEKALEKINAAATVGPQFFEWQHCRYNGKLFDAEVSLSKREVGGKLLVFAIVRDVTERKQAEQELLTEKMFVDTIINMMPGTFFMYEDGVRLVRWNKNLEKYALIPPDMLLNSSPDVNCNPEEKDKVMDIIDEVMTNGEGSAELERSFPDGSKHVFLYSGVNFAMNNKKYLLGTGNDVTAFKKAEIAIRESEERFRQIAENIEEVFFLLDKETRLVLYISPAIEQIFGLPVGKIVNTPLILAEYIHPNDRADAQFADLTKRYSMSINETFRIVRSDGDIRWIRLRSFLIRNEQNEVYRVAGIVADITEAINAHEATRLHQQQLIQADKLASIGMMVSGVAHEINNPNNLIMLNADVMKTIWQQMKLVVETCALDGVSKKIAGLPRERAIKKFETMIEGISGGALRIKRIVQGLKDFACVDSGEKYELLEINEVIESALSIIYPVVKKATTCFAKELSKKLPKVNGNYQKLEQVVINLIANACQALESSDKQVLVKTRYTKDTNSVVVEIHDEGTGITPENIHKIMDPFFTTKRDSGGTGLGLSVSYGIVKEHGGEMNCKSQCGVGTTVTVHLPAIDIKRGGMS